MSHYFIFIVLIISVFFDMKERRIPNKLVLPFIVFGLIYSAFQGMTSIFWALLAMLIVLLLFIVPFSLGWIGGGDVKLLMAIASITSVQFIIYTIIYTAIIGAVFGFLVIFINNHMKDSYEKFKNMFLNFLYMGKVDFTIQGAKDSASIPYSIPIFLGTIMAYIKI